MGGYDVFSSEHEWEFLHKHPEVRVLAGITSGLSIVGSLLIILSYLCFKDLRSRARLILVHISIMDCGVGIANLVGVCANFDHAYERDKSCLPNISYSETNPDPWHFIVCPPSKHIQRLCVSQAAFAHYFTLGSVIWTIGLSVFLYLRIVHHQIQTRQCVFYLSLVFSYLMPLCLTIILLATDKLGFSPYNSEGWCSVIFRNPTSGRRDILAGVINYDLWIYLTIFLVPLLSISTHVHIHSELKNSERLVNTERYRQALQKLDYKFLLIPVAFVILRIWSCILAFMFVYLGLEAGDVPKGLVDALLILSGIGDSGQGVTNAILFVLFAGKVRERFWSSLACRTLRRRHQSPLNGDVLQYNRWASL